MNRLEVIDTSLCEKMMEETGFRRIFKESTKIQDLLEFKIKCPYMTDWDRYLRVNEKIKNNPREGDNPRYEQIVQEESKEEEEKEGGAERIEREHPETQSPTTEKTQVDIGTDTRSRNESKMQSDSNPKENEVSRHQTSDWYREVESGNGKNILSRNKEKESYIGLGKMEKDQIDGGDYQETRQMEHPYKHVGNHRKKFKSNKILPKRASVCCARKRRSMRSTTTRTSRTTRKRTNPEMEKLKTEIRHQGNKKYESLYSLLG